jgi:hypothetical protein
MPLRRFVFLLAPLALAAAGCSSISGAPAEDAGHTDAGAPSDAQAEAAVPQDAATEATGTTDSTPACNTLTNAAPSVTIDQVAMDPPAPEGGTIADGTYWMTSVAIYTGADGPTGATGAAQTTIAITGATIQVVSAGEPATRTVTLATSGASYTSTDTCPDTTIVQGGYTATASTLVIELPGGTDDAGARTVVETFTKQ